MEDVRESVRKDVNVEPCFEMDNVEHLLPDKGVQVGACIEGPHLLTTHSATVAASERTLEPMDGFEPPTR
jgi:hypothetical protein